MSFTGPYSLQPLNMGSQFLLRSSRLKLLLSFPTALGEVRERNKTNKKKNKRSFLSLSTVFSWGWGSWAVRALEATIWLWDLYNPELCWCMLISVSCLVCMGMCILPIKYSFLHNYNKPLRNMFSILSQECVYICLHCFMDSSVDLASSCDMLLRVRVDVSWTKVNNSSVIKLLLTLSLEH